MENAVLYSKFNSLPDKLKKEVLDFIEFLIEKEKKSKKGNKSRIPKFGSYKGLFEMAPDFDEALEDFKEYMY